MSYDINPIRWFLQQLTPTSMNVFWSSKHHKGSTDKVEPFYGAQYSAEPLPQAWLDTIQAYAAVDAAPAGPTQQQKHQHGGTSGQERVQEQQQQQQHASLQQFAPLPGQLYLPPPNWAIPTDFDLRQQDTTQATAAAAPSAGSSTAAPSAPDSVVQQPGLCVWHKLDTSYGLPKVNSY